MFWEKPDQELGLPRLLMGLPREPLCRALLTGQVKGRRVLGSRRRLLVARGALERRPPQLFQRAVALLLVTPQGTKEALQTPFQGRGGVSGGVGGGVGVGRRIKVD